MRHFLCVLLFVSPLFAQNARLITPAAEHERGSFFLDGFEYSYQARNNYVVVVAAHSVINHHYLGVRVRVVNLSNHMVTVKPEDISAEDKLAGHALAMVTAAELTRRMNRPTNWARLAVTPVAGGEPGKIVTSEMSEDSQGKWEDMVREMHMRMAAMANGGGASAGSDMRFASVRSAAAGGLPPCDEVCQLRNREASEQNILRQLQQQNTPDYVAQVALLANTVPPDGDVQGMLYFPLPKGEHEASSGKHDKSRQVKVMVPVGDEKFEFELAVE